MIQTRGTLFIEQLIKGTIKLVNFNKRKNHKETIPATSVSDPDRSTTREQPQIKKSTKQRSIRLLTPYYNKTRYLKTAFVPKVFGY